MGFVLFETERLKVRSLQDSDFESLIPLMSDNEVMKYTAFERALEHKEIQEVLSKWLKLSGPVFGKWAVEHRANAQLIGWAMFVEKEKASGELGFMFRRDVWGQGFATELCRALIKHAFEKASVQKLCARAQKENKASIQVLEKIGMKKKVVSKELLGACGLYFEVLAVDILE